MDTHPVDLKPGDVIEHRPGVFGLIVSNSYPADTVPYPECNKYAEPGLIELKHQREDRWMQTHHFTLTLLPINERVLTYDAFRVQVERNGPFFSGEDLRRELRMYQQECERRLTEATDGRT